MVDEGTENLNPVYLVPRPEWCTALSDPTLDTGPARFYLVARVYRLDLLVQLAWMFPEQRPHLRLVYARGKRGARLRAETLEAPGERLMRKAQ